MPAAKIMTENPRTIAGSELAATALARMEKLSIMALLVPDAGGRLSGIIHLHDILKKGIA
jgi:arabinose-5-phosphate isomerase